MVILFELVFLRLTVNYNCEYSRRKPIRECLESILTVIAAAKVTFSGSSANRYRAALIGYTPMSIEGRHQAPS